MVDGTSSQRQLPRSSKTNAKLVEQKQSRISAMGGSLNRCIQSNEGTWISRVLVAGFVLATWPTALWLELKEHQQRGKFYR